MEQWNNLKSHFTQDGSLRDIIVAANDHSAWQLLIVGLKSAEFTYVFTHGGAARALPDSIEEIWHLKQSEPTLLALKVGNILIHCHFFNSEEIEFDIDPKDITSKSDFDTLLRFLSWLNRTTRSDVLITHENAIDEVIFKLSEAN